ncbi:hypothetical protein DFH07DRAFT_783533 [Mycena maculata]|uniref:Uncharacterized protein n=1 Tax=Mycena maculata TaxID=230809 RepID=A0AAD7HLI1_9AGAR|nr:hypothetical protein DFH07DRAFT_783533 [Mycena maculata]
MGQLGDIDLVMREIIKLKKNTCYYRRERFQPQDIVTRLSSEYKSSPRVKHKNWERRSLRGATEHNYGEKSSEPSVEGDCRKAKFDSQTDLMVLHTRGVNLGLGSVLTEAKSPELRGRSFFSSGRCTVEAKSPRGHTNEGQAAFKLPPSHTQRISSTSQMLRPSTSRGKSEKAIANVTIDTPRRVTRAAAANAAAEETPQLPEAPPHPFTGLSVDTTSGAPLRPPRNSNLPDESSAHPELPTADSEKINKSTALRAPRAPLEQVLQAMPRDSWESTQEGACVRIESRYLGSYLVRPREDSDSE